MRTVLDDDTLLTYSDDVNESTVNTNPITRATYFPSVQYRNFARVEERSLGVTLRYNFGQ